MSWVRVKAKAICTATESEQKVLQAVKYALGLKEVKSSSWSRVTGVHGEPLSIVEVLLEGEEAIDAARHVLGSLTKGYIDDRLEVTKGGYVLHVRLDKQSAYMGLLIPSDRDAVKIEIRTRDHPSSISEAASDG